MNKFCCIDSKDESGCNITEENGKYYCDDCLKLNEQQRIWKREDFLNHLRKGYITVPLPKLLRPLGIN
jgi:hypothetical protein